MTAIRTQSARQGAWRLWTAALGERRGTDTARRTRREAHIRNPGFRLCASLHVRRAVSVPLRSQRAAVHRRQAPHLALCVLIAVIGVTVSFQFQFQQRDVAYGELTSRFDSGPWWGIKVTPERRHLLDDFAADLRAQGRPDDELLVYYEGCGYYLFWRGAIASSAYSVS